MAMKNHDTHQNRRYRSRLGPGLNLKSKSGLLWVMGSSPGLRVIGVCDLDNQLFTFSVTL